MWTWRPAWGNLSNTSETLHKTQPLEMNETSLAKLFLFSIGISVFILVLNNLFRRLCLFARTSI